MLLTGTFCSRFLAKGAQVLNMCDDVIFTTFAENFAWFVASPTGIGGNKVKKIGKCCIIYILSHNLLDFTIGMIYNKA